MTIFIVAGGLLMLAGVAAAQFGPHCFGQALSRWIRAPSLALLFTVIIWGVGPVFLRTLSVDLGPSDHLAIRYTIVGAHLCGRASPIFGGWRIDARGLAAPAASSRSSA